MTAISVTSVNVLDNPSKVTNPLQFEIQYECMFDLADGERRRPVLSRVAIKPNRSLGLQHHVDCTRRGARAQCFTPCLAAAIHCRSGRRARSVWGPTPRFKRSRSPLVPFPQQTWNGS